MKKIFSVLLFIFSLTIYSQFQFQKTWATYYFGGDAYMLDSKIDNDNNIVLVGFVMLKEYFSFYNTFTTPNCHQPNISPDNNSTRTEIFLAKFSPSGSLIWATYYGGIHEDYGWSLATDAQNNIYIAGRTSSNSGIATAGSYIQTYLSGGNTSSFLAKFSSNGLLLWGTYLRDQVEDLVINGNNDIYLFGTALENSNLATSGAFIENFETYTSLASTNDNFNAFLLKFDANGNKLAGTYLGRVLNSDGSNMSIDSLGNIIVSYVVEQDNGFYGSPTSFQTTMPGITSLVLSKYNPDLTQRIWSTYFGGNNGIRVGVIKVDQQTDDIYLAGTTSCSNFIRTPNTHQRNLISTTDGYINKFNSNGNRIWGTYFGGENDFELFGNLSFKDNNLYFSGITKSFTNIATAGTYETVKTSLADKVTSFFGSFNKNNGTLNWCSYFGGETWGTKILSKDNYFYLTGSTYSQTGITTPNSLQPNFAIAPGSFQSPPGRNIVLARFDPNPLATNSFNKTKIILSPNPNRGSFSLQGNINNQDNLNLIIYDNLGRAVAINKINVLDNNINQTFNLENVLTSGVYFAKLTNENQVLETFKVLIR